MTEPAVDPSGHIPCIAPLENGGWGVFCLRCSSEVGPFQYPCKVIPDRPDFWPTDDVLFEVTNSLTETLAVRQDSALKMVRSRWMDQPSNSPEAIWLVDLIRVLEPE